MNVPAIGQGLGSVATLSGPQTGDAPVERGPAPPPGFTRVAWFDLNGDGHIDNRNPLDGGDGTLIVPAHTVDAPTYSRAVRRPELRLHDLVTSGRHVEGPAHVASQAGSLAATNVHIQRAVDAYQRYGQPVDNAPKDRAVA